MKIALDAMGGDYAPVVTIKGAIEVASTTQDINVVLVGDEGKLTGLLKNESYPKERIEILHASEVVPMDAMPSHAIRKHKDSSLRRSVEMVREGRADGAVSAGNSGAMMALALFMLGASEGVERPAIGTVIPSLDRPFILLDAGANVDCSAHNLYQFALMGDAYAKHILGRPSPRVAILSIGEEQSKGNELTKESYKLLNHADINFIGNIESKDLFMGHADAVVCDGFVGNIFLKTTEGISELLLKIIRREIEKSTLGKLGYMFMRPAFKNVKKLIDYDEYGGAPLFGINGTCIISHGRSSAKAIKNAIINAAEFSKKRVHEAVAREVRTLNNGVKSAVQN